MKKVLTAIVILAICQTVIQAQPEFSYPDLTPEWLPCLPEGITFSTQEQIDSFQINYPGCTVIEGDVLIEGNEITNLDSLSSIISVEGNLWLCSNPALASVAGLNQLTSVGMDLWITNNDILLDLSPIENLASIGYNLNILNNQSLTSLFGLNNIEPNSIINLGIYDNTSLFVCDVQSICNYLLDPGGTVDIYNNASGCNSEEEVEDACWVSIDDKLVNNGFIISPNPNSGSINIKYTVEEPGLVTISFLDVSGVNVKSVLYEQKQPGTYEMTIDLVDLKFGIYFCRVKTNPKYSGQTRKIIKLN